MGAFSFGFGTQPAPQNPIFVQPTFPSGSSGDIGDSSTIGQIFDFAQLGAQTFLADQAITSPRPATVQYAPNGQLMNVGSGSAATAGAGSSSLLTFFSTTTGLLVLFVLLLFFLRK